MRIRTITSVVGLLVSTSLAFASDAQAAPFNSPGYPNYTYEGKYPESTPCRYSLLQTKKATWTGSTITLKYFYNGKCGSFARIENAPPYCRVYLDRTRSSNPNPSSWDYVGETVDPGINFAYTKVGNNLGGRLSRAALVCGTGTVVTRTNWY
ncbi:hypothetical protein [Nostoc sp. PA-18-2419]|uniref:hypothetical protein n=1 Tax=Nostoc sp. PA-18-2419 TaxID=2575443 RepID=UPI00110877F6|nr:hypothetical protein [Nostoc sp. PA-18-2419]